MKIKILTGSFPPDFDLPESCAICGRLPTDDLKVEPSGARHGLQFECPQCGLYELVGLETISASRQWTPELRRPLSCATRQAAANGQPLRIESGEAAKEIADRHAHTRVSDNQESLLREIVRKAPRPNTEALFCLERDFTLIDCFSAGEFKWYIDSLAQEGLTSPGAAPSALVKLTLSTKGWSQVQPLPRTGGIPGTCFVAMSFAEEMSAAYQDGIAPAVSDAGFKPIRIDKKEHNNDITEEIVAGIRSAQFMVADFTGQRPGVYYEAGFALGLGRPVIWCCRKNEIKKLHFDTNHRNHVVWQNPQELRKGLYTRIRATILDQG